MDSGQNNDHFYCCTPFSRTMRISLKTIKSTVCLYVACNIVLAIGFIIPIKYILQDFSVFKS
jgi:hypothetical protein